MNHRELLSELSLAGITLRADGAELAVNAPKGALTPRLRALLAEHKPQLLRLLPAQHRDATGHVPPLVALPNERHEPFPMTDIQQAYCVGRNGGFEIGVAMHAYTELESDALDLMRLAAAWNKLIARHEMLRAVALPDGRQQILRTVPDYEIAVEDLRGLDPAAVAVKLAELRERLTHQVLPLDRWPLFELRACRLHGGRVRLFMSIDGTFLDAWSFQLLYRELVQYYRNPEVELTPERFELSFRDYVLATARLTEHELYQGSLRYWRARIATLPPAPELPLAMQPSALTQPRFGRRAARIEGEVYRQLQKRAQQMELTMPALLLAAYAEVLGQWSRSVRFTLNVPLFNRLPLHPEINQVMGTFSSFTLVEVDRIGKPSFAERARAIQQQLWDALEHQDVSGVQILREIFRSQGKITGALMPVVFTSFPSDKDSGRSYWMDFLAAELGEVLASVTQTPQVYLDHQVVYQPDALHYTWDAVENLYPAGMLDAMFSAYGRLLPLLAEDEDAWHALTLPLLPPEQEKLFAAVNATTQPRGGKLLHTAFVERAAERPCHPAVLSEQRWLSYGELHDWAKRLGHHLQRLGAQPQRPIGIVMEKGWEQVVAVLGVLFSGAPYLPLDVDQPPTRLLSMLADSGAEMVLTQPWLRTRFPWPDGLHVAVVETELPAEEPAPEVRRTPDDLACVIYTSGSTGTPDGVMVTHGGLVNAIEHTNRQFTVGTQDRALALTALHHDMSAYDIFGMLSAGGTIVMPESRRRRDPAHWLELLQRERVTIWNSVPAMMEILLTYVEGRREVLACPLRLTFLGGDWVPLNIPDRLRALAPGVQVISVGGPTETTLWNIWYPIREIDPIWKSIPYGKPIANTKYYVLNDCLEDRPVWVPGELCCAGVGVSAGYWGNPAKTAAKFVRHPRTGDRLYRTGDLGRYLPDGHLEFLGRVDFQLCLRGQRIEPEEIEAKLLRHPALLAAVALTSGEGASKQLVAYVVPRAGKTIDGGQLRQFLRAQLPEHMVPSAYIALPALPLSRNAKVDRQALAAMTAPESPLETVPASPAERREAQDLELALVELVRALLRCETVNVHSNFFELGANSLDLVRLHLRLKADWQLEMPITELFDHPTIRSLTQYLKPGTSAAPAAAKLQAAHHGETHDNAVAIVGLSCRFPGAPNIAAFWQNLVDGVESVDTFSVEELSALGLDAAVLRDPDYRPFGAPLADVESFDAAFFGMPPREARATDPQNRLFLECVWEALEDAGCSPGAAGTDAARVGIYAGKSISNYIYPTLAELTQPISFFQNLIGNDKDFLATLASYKLNLKGPSLNIQTACSTSLVAVALACQGLLHRDCDLALGGGATIKLPQRIGYKFEEGGIFSHDGHCRPFDAAGEGTVPGSGVGVVALKRLADAVADGDRIYGVIKGFAVNNDGAQKVGFTAPSVSGQAEVIAAAQAMAGVEPETIGYIEAHGTGTALGDPIEVAALTRVFRARTEKRQFCALGSVKSNFGHLDSAAGVAGLIKIALALHHRQLPPSLNFHRPNPKIDFANSPFFVNTSLLEWSAHGGPRRAGVSSFGIGGTNAHLVLEEGPTVAPVAAAEPRACQVLALAARSEQALKEMATRYRDLIAPAPHATLADICFSANAGRGHFDHRFAVVGEDGPQLCAALDAFIEGQEDPGLIGSRLRQEAESRVVFLCTGQGAQYAGMARQLHQTQPTFRRAVDTCDDLLRPHLPRRLLDVLYPPKGASSPIDEMTYAQPALFAVEYALAQLWLSWGVTPTAVMGHSTGEYVAACLAGVFSLETALCLVAARGRMMEELTPPGETVAVLAAEERVRALLEPFGAGVGIAAINAPENVVVSGTPQVIAHVLERLAAETIETKRLNIPRAAHSPLMEPTLAPFAEVAAAVRYAAPQIELISNLTGEAAGAEIATPEYWCRQIRHPVRFADGLRTLHARGYRLFVELGPKAVLSGLGQQNFPEEATAWLPSLRYGVNDWRQMLGSLARLYAHGVPVDWRGFDRDYPRRKVTVPTYPFQRQRYWIDGPVAGFQPRLHAPSRTHGKMLQPLLGRRVHAAALPPGAVQFEVEIGSETPAFLKDHRVFDTVILPAAAYIEIALAAAAQIFSSSSAVIEDLVFHQALPLPEGATKTVQIVLTPVDQGGYGLQIFSLIDGSAELSWICHAAGRVMRSQDVSPRESVPEPLPESIAVDAQYQRARERGNQFGPNFRLLDSLTRGAGVGLGWARLPEALSAEAVGPASYQFHPALLDACLQVVSTMFADAGTDDVYFPIGIERFACYDQAGPALWSRARVRQQGSPHTLTADLEFGKADGKIVARVTGLALKRASREALLGEGPELVNDWLYEVQWQEQEHRSLAAAKPDAPRAWLILGEDDGLETALTALLRARGDQCMMCADLAALEPMLDKFGRDLPSLAGVVYLCGPPSVDIANAAQNHCANVLALLQGLVKRVHSPSLCLVTRGAQAVTADDTVPGVAQSTLWGLGKVIAQEHPEVRCVRLDCAPQAMPFADARHVLEELEPSGEDQIALRGAARYVARLRRVLAIPAAEAPLFRPDASYLIAGGLGRLGLLVARWMATRGARHLVLVGRKEAGPTAKEELRELERLGAHLLVVRADIADRAEVARVLAVVGEQRPPLRGIIHCAGVLEDGVLQQQTAARFARVLAPKVSGAWYLHELSRGAALDHFVLFSSVASLFGAPGQSNHAAGNAFMDALAHHRRAQGLPGLSINWGIWSGVGAATVVVNERLRVGGMRALAPPQGLAILGRLLGQPHAQVGVVPLDWADFTWAGTPFCRALAVKAEPAAPHGSDLRQRLATVSATAGRELLREFVQRHVAWILGLPISEPLDPQQGFYAMGIDSLASLQLRNRLQAALDTPLPATLLFNHPTIEALTDHLSATFLPQAAPELGAGHLGSLSAEELAQRLAAQIESMNGAREPLIEHS